MTFTLGMISFTLQPGVFAPRQSSPEWTTWFESESRPGDFHVRIKQKPNEVQVVAWPGYVGRGSLGIFEVAIGAFLRIAVLMRRRN